VGSAIGESGMALTMRCAVAIAAGLSAMVVRCAATIAVSLRSMVMVLTCCGAKRQRCAGEQGETEKKCVSVCHRISAPRTANTHGEPYALAG
jgi:hypothetical protein